MVVEGGEGTYFEEPFMTPEHFFRYHDVAGVLISNSNVLLEKADNDTGKGVSLIYSLVRSLNCLQNSAILRPRGPNA